MPSLDIDGFRFRSLSIGGWLALAIGLGVLAWGVIELVKYGLGIPGNHLGGAVIGGIVGFVALAFAYDSGTPEYEGTCDACGAYVCVDSSRDGADEYLVVCASGSPRRISYGPLSAVTQRQTTEWIYCSGECADADTRVILSEHDVEILDSQRTEVDA